MLESIARRERLETPPSTSPCYVWAVPQKPVSVRLPFELIDRMEREAVDNFRSLTSRGSEIGGLLLGSVAPGSPAVVTVEDYEIVESDHSRGPLYRLSDADLGRFERAIESRGSGAGPRVVGFFRSHTRKGVALDSEDLAFFEARFRDPNHIALLIRPFATKASVGGIFIRENGTVRGEASYQEFPFRSGQLSAGDASAAAAAPSRPDVPESGPAVTPPLPAPPKPATRAQIVPIATRREISFTPAAPPPAPAPEPPKAAEPPKVAESPKLAEPPAAPEPERAPAPPAPAAASPAAPAAEPPKKEPAAPAAPPDGEPEIAAPTRRKLPLIAAGAAALVLLAGGALFFYPGLLHRGSTLQAPAAPPRQDSSPLSLRVERTANSLLLTWNREADTIQHAQSAQLSISDGEQQENYRMGIDELLKGSIVYEPRTQDVSFRMEVMNQRGEKTGSELVRVLRNSPMPETGQKPAQAAQSAAGAAPGTESAADQPPAGTENAPKAAPASPKPFRMESLSQRLRPSREEEVPDAPALGGMTNAGSMAPPPISMTAGAPTPPVFAAPAAVPAPAAAPQKKASPQAGGRIQQAQLIVRKEPVYPPLARQTGVKGAVEVQATIGADGKVKNVKVLHGHPMLQKAAVDAIMQWVYKPTMLNGVAVESQTQIILNFVGEK